ncbi:Uncharacterised protein [Vibrio cholerae]|nr:Uncharacterised protein [Vibrio cholerae]CSI67998.1 Uncharacterised protein [Vibrio cholerae]CSI82635.1 Uncharacterised protein [Vibrio cholerae]
MHVTCYNRIELRVAVSYVSNTGIGDVVFILNPHVCH